MKSLFYTTLISLLTISLSACSDSDDSSDSNSFDVETVCGSYNGHTLYTGPRGGCYYYNSNNNKSYVNRSYCDCF